MDILKDTGYERSGSTLVRGSQGGLLSYIVEEYITDRLESILDEEERMSLGDLDDEGYSLRGTRPRASSSEDDGARRKSIIASTLCMAADLERRTRGQRRTALNLSRDAIVTTGKTLHDTTELIVDSVIQLPWKEASKSVYDGTLSTIQTIGQTGVAVAAAVAATPLGQRIGQNIDHVVTSASMSTMAMSRSVLENFRSRLDRTITNLDSRIVGCEHRLNPPKLSGHIVHVDDEDFGNEDDEVILVSKLSKNSRLVERPTKSPSPRPDLLDDDDDDWGSASATASDEDILND